MYCIFSRESLLAMKGIRGKLAAQAGHAYLHSYWDSIRRFPKEAWAYEDSRAAVKICLVVETNQELVVLENVYRDKCGVSLVTDAARTVLDQPMITCLGLGPLDPADISSDLRELPTLT